MSFDVTCFYEKNHEFCNKLNLLKLSGLLVNVMQFKQIFRYMVQNWYKGTNIFGQ